MARPETGCSLLPCSPPVRRCCGKQQLPTCISLSPPTPWRVRSHSRVGQPRGGEWLSSCRRDARVRLRQETSRPGGRWMATVFVFVISQRSTLLPRIFRSGPLVIVVPLLMGGPWYARAWAAARNPRAPFVGQRLWDSAAESGGRLERKLASRVAKKMRTRAQSTALLLLP